MGHAVLKQYVAGLIATLGFVIQGQSLGWPSPVLVKLENTGVPMTLDDHQKSWMVSLLYIGNFISPIPSGYVMDKLGRKKSALLLSVIPLVSWILVLFGTDSVMLYVSRFLQGTWSGASYTILPIYIGEIAQPNVRGALSTFIQIMIYIGVFYEYAIGPFVSYNMLAIMNTVIPIIFLFLFAWMPESPYWYLMKGKRQNAVESLSWLRGTTAEDIEDELCKIEESVKEQMKNKKTFTDLVATKGNRKGLMIVQLIAIFQRMSGISGLMAYTSITLPKEGIDPDECVMVMGLVWIISTFASTVLIDSLGRRPLLFISCFGTAIPMALAAVWFYLRYKTEVYIYNTHWAPFVCMIVYGVFFSMGLGPVASTIQSEMFPSNTKGLASAVTSISLGVTSFVMNVIYLRIARSIGMYFNFVIFSAASFVCMIFVLCCVIETKGKTLQEIQDELHSKRKKTTSV